MARGNTFMLLETFAVFFGFCGSLLVLLHRKQNVPYMDEVFHIPQVKQYCSGNFSEVSHIIAQFLV